MFLFGRNRVGSSFFRQRLRNARVGLGLIGL
jgi:hypothetical protein